MLNYGTGNPRFIHSGTSLDFTPTTHCIMTKKEPRSEDITRFSQITTANKYFEIGSHLELSYRIYNLTKAQIDALEAVIGETIQFYPHSDVGVSFSALVLNVQPKMEKNLAFLYYVDITVLSVNYFKFGTNLTLTSPNGSEVLQRNQVFNITWTSYGITGNVALELWKNGSKLSDIDTSEVNDGTYAWTVPADATIGTDYQIKILNSTGYIYDLSDANFGIYSNAYYHFDGTDDSVLTPLTSIMAQDNDTFIYECDFNLGSTNGEIIFFGNTNGAKFHLNATTTTYYANAFGWSGMYRYYYTDAYTRDNQWHHLEATLVLGASGGARPLKSMVVKVDGVAIAGFNNAGGGATTNGYDWSIGKSGANYTAEMSIKNIKVTTSQSSVLDGFIYPCNETSASMGTTPYTNKTIDTSTYDNNGTPVNITPATFCNNII